MVKKKLKSIIGRQSTLIVLGWSILVTKRVSETFSLKMGRKGGRLHSTREQNNLL
jgi:hypothetical protein